jgi:hemerythrin-like domain-containing protein
MSRAIDTIRSEHHNMTRLLDILDHQINLFERAIQPDYDLIKEIIDYFLTFPDLYHHPKEDLIFRRIKKRAPEIAENLFDLEQEHGRVSERLHAFTRAVVNVMLEVEVPRDQFVAVAREFIEGERKHMSEEEGHFFKLAEETLDETDWDAIDRAIEQFTDPLQKADKPRFRNVMVYLGSPGN